MTYGTIKVDTVTFTNDGVDKSVTLSGLVQNPTFSGNVTVTGTLSGVTVTGTTANFTSGNFTNISGGTHTITSGVFAAGSAASPSITFTGDLNTGIYSPGADQVAISTGGSGRLFVDASGRLGVGTSSPSDTLQINKTGAGGVKVVSTTQSTIYFSNATETGGYLIGRSIGSDNAHNLFSYDVTNSHYVDYFEGGSGGYRSFYTNGAERLRITSAGLVGVGTSLPSSIASGYGVVHIAGTNGGGINFGPTTGAVGYAAGSASGVEIGTIGTTSFSIFTNNQTRATVTSAGLVGIGTSSPGYLLDVVSAGASDIRVKSGGAGSAYLRLGTATRDHAIYLDASTGSLVAYDITSATTRLVIDSSGRVGIGTSSPSCTLDVAGTNARLKNASGSVEFVLSRNSNSAGASISLNTGDTNKWFFGLRGLVDDKFYFYNNVAGNTALTIDESSRLGIGTTSPGKPLDVRGTGSANIGSFSNGAQGIDIATTASGGSIQTYDQNQTLDLKTFGTTTNSINFTVGSTERARIDSSGRLLVGTSSARSTATLGTNYQVLIEKAGDYAGFSVFGNKANNQGSYFVLGKSRGTTAGAVNTVAADDILGYIGFEGTDGTSSIRAADISVAVDGTPGANDMPGRLVFSTTADGASSPTERMRITQAGHVFVGNVTGDYNTVGISLFSNGNLQAVTNQIPTLVLNRKGSDGVIVDFYRDTNNPGTISVTTTATSYNTSSDYRLKENVTPVTDGITRLQQLKPSRFNFIAAPGCTVDGFIAHEVQSVVPEAITGEKDAVDADGKPQYQGIDQSKLVPLLTAALQEAIAKIESLEARLTAAGI